MRRQEVQSRKESEAPKLATRADTHLGKSALETNFDVTFIAGLALREKQIQQNYRPIIAVHKWFARRPGTLFRGLLLAEFVDGPLQEAFFRANDLRGRVVADPFMGGGTPLLEANRVGCEIIGYDINPMAVWIVREEIDYLDMRAYETAARKLRRKLETEIGDYYATQCSQCNGAASAKYFLWVKVQQCQGCRKQVDLFPGYLLAEDRRHPKNVLVCPSCGSLNEVEHLGGPGSCKECHCRLQVAGPARRSRCRCAHCGMINVYPNPAGGIPQHRMFAIEYHCSTCKTEHQGRFFKRPDASDLAKHAAVAQRWERITPRFVPAEKIPPGDETDRLHRWGYQRYRDLFDPRQLMGLEMSCRMIAQVENRRVQRALATNLSDLLRYQNMLCRYDTMALKSLDIFSIHGFPVGLVQCESNLLGIHNGSGMNVGSGGWSNIIDKYIKAKRYCLEPFEVSPGPSRKAQIPIRGEWIGDRRSAQARTERRRISLHCQSSTSADLPRHSLDGVFTDPPYFGNVQYGELMDFCYTWLRRLVGKGSEGFGRESTRHSNELTGNRTMERGLEHFTEGLAAVFGRMGAALKPGAPLVFTYHHNNPKAYDAVGVALLDAGLVCSATLPCPAEMGGSIHIHGTESSIVDTVFVCRSRGKTLQRWLFQNAEGLAAVVADDIAKLRAAGHKPSLGDLRCIIYGHLTRMAIWKLRDRWQSQRPTRRKHEEFAEVTRKIAGIEEVMNRLDVLPEKVHWQGTLFDRASDSTEVLQDAVPF